MRLHKGHDAKAAAKDLQARAFALGPHITFSGSTPPSDTAEGERLQAHEVAHTLESGPPKVRRWRDLGAEAEAKDYTKGQKTYPPPEAAPVVPIEVYAKIQALVGTKEGEGNWWVGPLDEHILEALWGSLGDQVLTDLTQSDKRSLWVRSIKAGAELHTIPAMRKIQRMFIGVVAGIARGFLDKNKATAEGEKAALNADPSSAPSPPAADRTDRAATGLRKHQARPHGPGRVDPAEGRVRPPAGTLCAGPFRVPSHRQRAGQPQPGRQTVQPDVSTNAGTAG